MTELVFPDRAAYLAWGAAVGTGALGEQVAGDELKFLDPSRTRAYIIEEHVTTRWGCAGKIQNRSCQHQAHRCGAGRRASAPLSPYGQRTVTSERQGLRALVPAVAQSNP